MSRLQDWVVVVLASPGLALGWLFGGLAAWGRLLAAGYRRAYFYWIPPQPPEGES